MSDFPPPVGMIATTSLPPNTATTASCCGLDLKPSNPKWSLSPRSAVASALSGTAGPASPTSEVGGATRLRFPLEDGSSSSGARLAADRLGGPSGRGATTCVSNGVAIGTDTCGGASLAVALLVAIDLAVEV